MSNDFDSVTIIGTQVGFTIVKKHDNFTTTCSRSRNKDSQQSNVLSPILNRVAKLLLGFCDFDSIAGEKIKVVMNSLKKKKKSKPL